MVQASSQRTADEAFAASGGSESSAPLGKSTSFVCPHCSVYALHDWGIAASLNVRVGLETWATRLGLMGAIAVFARCSACLKEVVFVDGRRVWPRSVEAPKASADLPADLAADFEEARLIHADSPRGAAALLRLVLQKLCPLIGATKTNINEAIGELVASGRINPALQQALDSVRVIGNEAVHPGELDLRDDSETVLRLFRLINFIVEKAITEPKEIAAIYGSLPPAKLAGIADRDGKAADPRTDGGA